MTTGKILAIESSCDETAAAVVARDLTVLSSVVSSQIALHESFGGVVPEIAGRAHLEVMEPVVEAALVQAGASMTRPDIDAVAVTAGPGLIGSLLVGLSAAKALCLAWGVPLIAVNHMEGHLFAAQLENPNVAFPAVTLLVSGGHTEFIEVRGPGHYRLLGATIDDAAGEAYDKVARYVGLGYPGGPAIDRLAQGGNPKALKLPRAMMGDGLDVSFSGLKSAVIRAVDRDDQLELADIAASFQAAAVDVLVAKAMRAVDLVDAKTLVLGGGVAANSELRRRAQEACDEAGIACALPSLAMCTDNAAMIGAAGWHRLAENGPNDLKVGADPSWQLEMEVLT